ncbi:MAG: DNA translocase FtsK, partial [Planctomycetota bacterium]
GRQGKLFGPVAADTDLVTRAQEAVVAARRASASLLQRRLRVSFGEAVELLDVLREQGWVDGEPGEATGQVLHAGEATGEAAAEA